MKIVRTAVGSIVTWGFIKELQKLGVEIIGVDCNPQAYAKYKLDKFYVVPKVNDPKFIDVILDICDIEEPDCIISGPEEELLELARNVNLLGDVVLLAPEYHYLEICTDKLKMDRFLRQIEVPTPELLDISVEGTCVIKPRFGRGSVGVTIVARQSELDLVLDNIENPIIQEYIDGDEYSVDVLADREGNVLNCIPRLRMEIVKGKSVRSRTVWDMEISEYCKKIVKGLRLFGLSCIQCIKNESGVYFIDINPRFGGGSILSIKADPTFIPNMIKLIKGETPIPSLGYKEGLTMLRYYKEVYIKNGK